MSPDSQKKPYEKPAVVSESIFETNALACGKCQNINQLGMSVACSRGRPQSS